jgi:hypothetical protein
MADVQPGRELWQRTQIDLRAPSHGPNGGVTDSLDEAKATFRMAWAAPLDGARPRAGQRPLSSEKADEKCSL